ncbi:MAG: 23S rRNA (uracil(1939)-C(5))-methyltransferase RlmD [Acholeplasmataceae bacterium]|nr:23S rRNA (uracil(1939)-C(5))-methyltransferase RlmD [Acholeplasmataceae bacterium]
MLTVGNVIKEKVVDVDYLGQGVIKHDGYVIFVPKLIEGELAKVEITKVKKNFCQGKVIEIIEESSDRSQEHSELDALNLYHMTPQRQIKWQEKTTIDTFRKIADMDVQLDETINDERYVNYRNKSVFHVIEDSVLRLGLYDETKNNLIEVDTFILADETTNKILKFISDAKFKIEKNGLTHVVFRTNLEGKMLITFVAKKDQIRGITKISEALQIFNFIVGITYNVNRNHKVILGKESITLYGENIIRERLNGVDMLVNDRAFFQINLPVIQKAYQIIKDDLSDNDVVLDAYSGIGSIGYYIYDKVHKVIMVESNKQNINLAHEIRDQFGIKNVEIAYQRAELYEAKEPIDKVICDPPRNGLMPEFVDMLIKLKPKKIYYLSCDVKTLSRDINLLKEDYQIEVIHPIRMFYHTTSLETLVVLKQK